MIRIDHRTVELSEPERRARVKFEQFLDEGHGIHDAVAATKLVDCNRMLSPAFWAYLAGED